MSNFMGVGKGNENLKFVVTPAGVTDLTTPEDNKLL
jgi:hypothetical protein